MFEALHMYTLAWAFAFAGRDQEVVSCAIITETELAVSLDYLIVIVDPVELAKEELFFLIVFLGNSTDLDNSVLHSS